MGIHNSTFLKKKRKKKEIVSLKSVMIEIFDRELSELKGERIC